MASKNLQESSETQSGELRLTPEQQAMANVIGDELADIWQTTDQLLRSGSAGDANSGRDGSAR